MVNGKQVILLDGYTYYKKNKCGKLFKWACTGSASCKAWLKVDDNLYIYHRNASHCHPMKCYVKTSSDKPLTGAERQRRYRQKLKNNNPEKFEELKKKNSEQTRRNYRKVNDLNERERELQRQKWRKQKQEQGNRLRGRSGAQAPMRVK